MRLAIADFLDLPNTAVVTEQQHLTDKSGGYGARKMVKKAYMEYPSG